MKRNSLFASVAALGLIFTMGTGAALATPQNDEDPEAPVTLLLDQPPSGGDNTPDLEDPADGDAGDGNNGASEDPDGDDEETPDTEENNEPSGTDPAETSDPDTPDATESPAQQKQLQRTALPATPAPTSIGSFPDIGDILDPSFWWPLPTGVASAEPDPVFKRGSSGYHDPFVVAGTFAIPNVDLLAAPLKEAAKGELCSNPAVTTGVHVAALAAVKGQLPLLTVPTTVDSMDPNADQICADYVDSLTPSEILDVVPLDVHVTMTNQDDPSDVRETTVPFSSVETGVANLYAFAAASSDFPGGYFNAGTYDIKAELMADATITLPKRTVETTVDWTGTRLFRTVHGTNDVSMEFPPINVSYTLDNQPLARLINTPTMTVIAAPDVAATWDYHVGLRVNNEGYDGNVSGHVDYPGGDLDAFNKYFRTDILLYKVGRILPVQTVRVALDENFDFSHDFVDLEEGDYLAVPVISSTHFLPVPVTGAKTLLTVANIRADFDAPTLDCLQETGNYQLEGSVHNNALPPVWVNVELQDADGQALGSQTVPPLRTHFDINAEVGPGDYSATFSARGARSVTIDGPSVEEGECAALTDVGFDPNPATNVCPAVTADTTLSGTVEGYRDGYTVVMDFYSEDQEDWEASAVPVDVEEDGSFTMAFPELPAGNYHAAVTLLYNEQEVPEQTVDAELTVQISDCPVPPKPGEKPGEKPAAKPGEPGKSGGLAKTGASIGLALALSAAAIGGGTFLRRRNQ